jgi:hypothetical protein
MLYSCQRGIAPVGMNSSSANENLSDIQQAAVADGELRNVFVHSSGTWRPARAAEARPSGTKVFTDGHHEKWVCRPVQRVRGGHDGVS